MGKRIKVIKMVWNEYEKTSWKKESEFKVKEMEWAKGMGKKIY